MAKNRIALGRLIAAYQIQYPNITAEEAEQRALELRRELQRSNTNWNRSQRRQKRLVYDSDVTLEAIAQCQDGVDIDKAKASDDSPPVD